MAYKVIARFYMYPDQMGEAYVIVSNNAEKDTKFEIGHKVDIYLNKNEQVDTASKLKQEVCKCEHGDFDLSPYCRRCGGSPPAA